MFSKSHLLSVLGAGLMVVAVPSVASAAADGGFFVHVNQQQNNSDSRRSVTFYDADDMSAPIFSVFPGFEGGTNFEEVEAIDVDPVTGDVYMLAFDSGSPGVPDTNGIPDSQGVLDLYRIDFQAAYNYWEANLEGKDVRGLGLVNAPSPVPAAPNNTNLDYVTFGNGPTFTDFSSAHSNTVALPGVVEKIGEVRKNEGGQGFFDYSLEFIDENTLLLLDDSTAPDSAESPATDHTVRILERVNTASGFATVSGTDGGYNLGTTESWESRTIQLVNQDFAGGVPVGHSEPESTAFYEDPITGVRGVWVTESDSSASTRGDDIAFLELDASGNSLGYREHQVGAGPTYPTSFALDDDPFVNATLNDGQADNIFVDADTGDLIIIESGFGDNGIATVGADHEPSVIRREVISYDNGSGRIQFGAWGQKQILNPLKDSAFLERGHWGAYDSVNDLAYFIVPDTGNFLADIFVMDVNTGVTTSYLDVDDSISLFFGDSFGDVADFFTLGVAIPGDLDGDGFVGLSDLDIILNNWNQNVPPANPLADPTGDGFVGLADLDIILNNWNAGTPPAASAIPEPASLALFTIAGLSALARRRARA